MYTFANVAISILSFPSLPRALHKIFVSHKENLNTLFCLININFELSCLIKSDSLSTKEMMLTLQ